jgi:Outer membrane receptor for ferrienterochelin and colicins
MAEGVFKSKSLRYLPFLFLLLFLMPAVSFAQNATIVGTVTDPSGAVMPNVNVTVTNPATGWTRTFPTNDAGQYVVPDIQIGHYNVRAEASGFKIAEQKEVVLQVGDRLRVDFQMNVGASSETVTVEANAIAVQADSGEQSSLVNSTQITELATNGRTIYTYVALTPGAASLMPDTQNPVPVGGNGNLSFNGNRPGHNLYLLDGGENSDRGGAGSSSVMPSIDAIAETKVLTSNYSADYGLSSGGTISTAIKSGTQTLHASAWEFFRNDALDARYFFNNSPDPVSKLRYNIYGFNIGGPVTLGKLYNPEKKKTFFFYNMEWRKIINGGSPINRQVPDPANYGGNFGSTAIDVPAASQVSASVLARNCPNGVLPAGIVQGAPFPNNTIPTCMLDPNAQSLLTAGGPFGGIFPAPTTTDQNGNPIFSQPVAVPTNVREEIVRIDHNFTDKFSVFGHFVAEQINQEFATSMWSGDNVPSVGNTFGNPSYAGVVHATYAINPSLVNEASFNYNGNRIAITPTGLVSLPTGYTGTRFFTGPNVDNRIPSINLAGTTGAQYTVNWMPWNNLADSYQIRDDVSWTKGRHQLKIGGGWLYYKKTQDWFKNTQGNFRFDGTFSGNDFADYLLGLGQNYTEDAIKSAGNWNNTSWALYIQDNWRVTNRLTLNLGLRWDGIPHTYEANKQMNNFYPQLYDPAQAAVLNSDFNTINPNSPGLGPSPDPILAGQLFYINGIATCGEGVPRGCVDDSWLNFQPRIGFAYDLTGNGKTIIRGGFGLMNERIQGNDVYNNAGTVPLSASIGFNNVLFSDPTVSLTGGGGSTSVPVNNITGLDKPNYASPRSSQFSLGVQQSIGRSVLSLSYVGTQNRHQNYYTNVNLPDISLLPGFLADSSAYNASVPFLGYRNIRVARNEANSDYNSLQATWRGTWHNDLTYQVLYTYSHTNDAQTNGSSAGDLGDVSNPYAGWKYDFGPANFDIQHIFGVNFVYAIPFMKNAQSRFAKTLLGGWEISGIVSAVSGPPINIGLSGTSITNVVPSGNPANRPDQTGSGSDPHTVDQWFDTSIYAAPACVTGPDCWGNAKRNSVRGPGRHNWNISLFKNFMFNEARGTNLQFRAEFFNIWNHPQFAASSQNGGVSNNFGAGDFGRITSSNDPRIIQLALKFYF